MTGPGVNGQETIRQEKSDELERVGQKEVNKE